jgi:signal transduction histidine kinase
LCGASRPTAPNLRDSAGPVGGGERLAPLIEQVGREVGEPIQAERVAAWRELARRLAHELKNPLFPLQITIENLQRARAQAPDQFDEILGESTATRLEELQNLKTIIGRFSDFAKMPAPRIEAVDLNEVVRGVLRLFEPQWRAEGRPAVNAGTSLDETLGTVPADPDLPRRALQNLVLNAIDAMPGGGTPSIRTLRRSAAAVLEVSDTGEGLTAEECDRLFTPYYATKQPGTGLGLAIVQSVVSDHRGRITVESEPGRGTTFRLEFPLTQPLDHPATP